MFSPSILICSSLFVHLTFAAVLNAETEEHPWISASSNQTWPHSASIGNLNLTDRHDIYCRPYEEQFYPTTVKGCKPTLDYIRSLEPFNRKQEFYVRPPFSTPKSPSEPPYAFTKPASDCLIRVFSRPSGVRGKFSWRDVREVAIEVIEFCATQEGMAGMGGFTAIGEPYHQTTENGWLVLIEGKAPSRVSSAAGEEATDSSILDPFAVA